MAAQLKIDNEVLDSLNRSMEQIRDVLGNAEGLSQHTAAASGDGTLAARLHDFSHKWEDTRNDMMEGIAKFASMVSTVAQSFEQLEEQLVSALHGGK